MEKIRIIMLIVCLFISADLVAAFKQWDVKSGVVGVKIVPNGDIYVIATAKPARCATLSVRNTNGLGASISANTRTMFLSVLLSAKLSGSELNITYNTEGQSASPKPCFVESLQG